MLQRLRDLVAKVGSPVQDGDFVERDSLLHEFRNDCLRNGPRLHIEAIGHRPECEFAFGRAGNLPVVALLAQGAQRSADNSSARPIIEAQPDRPDIGVFSQAFEQLRVCSRETVYRLVCVADGEQTNASAEAQQENKLVQRMAEILVFVDEQDGETGAKCISDPVLFLDHAIGQQRHIVEIDQALPPKLALISFDEYREFRISASPFWPGAIDVSSTFLRGEAPPAMRVVWATDGDRVGILHRSADLDACCDPEIRSQANRRASSIGRDHLAKRKAMHRPDEGAIASLYAKARKARLELNCALVVICDACDAAWFSHILCERSRHCSRERLGFAASRAG